MSGQGLTHIGQTTPLTVRVCVHFSPPSVHLCVHTDVPPLVHDMVHRHVLHPASSLWLL